MSQDLNRVKVSLEQMERLFRALEDLREQVLPNDPNLFATMAEGPLDDLEKLRREVSDYVRDLQPTS